MRRPPANQSAALTSGRLGRGGAAALLMLIHVSCATLVDTVHFTADGGRCPHFVCLSLWRLASRRGRRAGRRGGAARAAPSVRASSPPGSRLHGRADPTRLGSARRRGWWAWCPTPPTGTSPTATSSWPRFAWRR